MSKNSNSFPASPCYYLKDWNWKLFLVDLWSLSPSILDAHLGTKAQLRSSGSPVPLFPSEFWFSSPVMNTGNLYVSYHPRCLKGPAQVWSAAITSTEGEWAPQRQCPDTQHLLEEQYLSPAAFIGYGQQLCAEEKGSCYHPVALVTFSLILVLITSYFLTSAINWLLQRSSIFMAVLSQTHCFYGRWLLEWNY